MATLLSIHRRAAARSIVYISVVDYYYSGIAQSAFFFIRDIHARAHWGNCGAKEPIEVADVGASVPSIRM